MSGSSVVQEIGEPGYGQSGGLENGFEGFRFQNAVPMDGNSHAMCKAIAESAVQVHMASFLIEHHKPGLLKGVNDLFTGDPRKARHYTATSSASISFAVFAFFSRICSFVTARRYNLMASRIF